MNRREFIRSLSAGTLGLLGTAALGSCAQTISPRKPKKQPNILFCLADDWSWPHASIAGDKVVKTPTFDRVAREGVLFENAFVSSPSCTPSRGAILTGQYHWRLEEGGNLWSTLPAKFDVYPDLLLQGLLSLEGRDRKKVDPDQVSSPRLRARPRQIAALGAMYSIYSGSNFF